jgi:succinylarginine dihydrolase
MAKIIIDEVAKQMTTWKRVCSPYRFMNFSNIAITPPGAGDTSRGRVHV